MARFGWYGLRSAYALAKSLFAEDPARALIAGCAGHSILPLTHPLSAAVGMVFALTGHVVDWPCAEGGSHAITVRRQSERDRSQLCLRDTPEHSRDARRL